MDISFSWKKSAKLPLILQEENAECGHACVAMVSHFLGHVIDLSFLRKKYQPSSAGMNLLQLKHLCQELHFNTRALRVSLEELRFVQCPAILHWNMNHFVVLKKVTRSGIIIHDPALGIRSCLFQEASKFFTGIVLEVEKAPQFLAIKQKTSLSLLDLVRSMHGLSQFIGLLIFISMAIEIFSLVNPLFMQYVTDSVLQASEPYNVYVMGIVFLSLATFQVFFEYIRGNMVIYLSSHLSLQLSSMVMQHILKLPLDFFEKRHKGDIQSKFQSIEHIQKKISVDCIHTLLDGVMMLMTLMVMLMYSSILTLVVLVHIAVYIAVRAVSYHFLRKHTMASVYQHARSASVFLENLQGMLPIKSYLKEKVRFNAWKNHYIESLNADIKISKLQVLYQSINQLLLYLDPIVIICIASMLIVRHQFSVGMLIAFLAYRLLLVNKAFSFIHTLFDYKLIAVQLTRLSDIMLHPTEPAQGRLTLAPLVQGCLSVKNISFTYGNEGKNKTTLNKINIDIVAGEKVVIIGPSGCGKTTLLKIMMGLLVANEGEVCIDGIPIQEFGLQNYRQFTGCVMQEDMLFSGSLVENISFFEECIDMERVYEVAKLCCIHETICSFPMGYETLVGDMGSLLSGGQKQRILLARALYKKPKILFLDEATSHLDVYNEASINQALKMLDITQIMVAHRKETIAMADRTIDLRSCPVNTNS